MMAIKIEDNYILTQNIALIFQAPLESMQHKIRLKYKLNI